VNEFGLSEVRSWKWGLMPEMDNALTFITSDNNSITTKNAVFKLYDYTVAAIESVLGASNVNVGIHFMGCHYNVFYDGRDFIDHCVSGTNYYTSTTGTQLDFLASSSYYLSPGDRDVYYSPEDSIGPYKTRAMANGISLEYGFDEGYVLYGPDSLELKGCRTAGISWNTAHFAELFRKAVLYDWDYITVWRTDSNADWFDVPSPTGNLMRLAYMMSGSGRQLVERSGSPALSTDMVHAVSGFNTDDKKVYVLAYNQNDNISSTTSEDITINISNIAADSGSTVTVKKWIIDDDHSSYWKTWWNNKGSTVQTLNGFSKYDISLPNYLNETDRQYWTDNKSTWISAGELMSPETTTATPSNGSISISGTIAHHGVVLYELSNAKYDTVNPTPTPVPPGINLALGKTASASSTYSGYSPSAINDEDISQWYQWASDGSPMPQWVQLDLGSSLSFNRVELYTKNNYELRGYKIQYWNGAVWQDCVEVTGNTQSHRTHTFLTVTGSKIRVYCTQGDSATNYARVDELELYYD